MLSGLKKIINEDSSSRREIFLEVNPYLHSSRKALQLIAGLNKPTSLNSKESNVFKNLDNLIYSDDFERDCDAVFNNYTFTSGIRKEYELMKTSVSSSHDEDWTKIVLGGEFSAGKSSFLNSLLCDKGEIEFLPVSEKPTSVIPTYIYCSNTQKIQYAIGENIQKGKMFLSLHALLALGHDFERKHQISLGVFLNRLIIQQPIQQNFLNDVVFVDTPGYNKEDGESKRDKLTAINAVKTAEVLFWLIDIENGTVKQEDFSFIRSNYDKGKPKVIIINKADKWTPREISKIIIDIEIILKAKNDDSIIDIIAYSSHDRQIFETLKGNEDWQSIFDKIKSKARRKKAEQDFMDLLKSLLKDIKAQNDLELEDLDEDIKKCNRKIIEINNEENFDFSNIKKEIDRYYHRSLELQKLCYGFKRIAISSLKRELDWEKKLGFFDSADNLMKLSKSDYDYYKILLAKDTEVVSISEGVFKNLNSIESNLREVKKDAIENLKKLRNSFKQKKDDLNLKKKKFNEIVNLIEFHLKKSIKELNQNKSESNFGNLPIVGVVKPKRDIFNCITNNDYEGFLDCLSKKTEISNLKNHDGLNILSTAVMNRRYDMVSVLLPKALRLIDRKENDLPSAREIAENNDDQLMVELLMKPSN